MSIKSRNDLIPVIVGGDIGAYALGREFHEAFGCTCISVNNGSIAAMKHSNIFRHRVVNQLDGPTIARVVTEIAQVHPQMKIALVANTDALIESLIDAKSSLPANVVCPIPSRNAFNAVCDKISFSALCKKHGLDVPQMEVVSLAGTNPIAQTQIPFPVVAKPAVSAEYSSYLGRGFKKIYFIKNQSELSKLWINLREAGFSGEFLVQELIGGDDTYMDSLTLYIGGDGSPRRLGAAQVLLEDHAPTMVGNPVSMMIRKKPELWEKATRMLVDVGYRGFANFDVKRDPKTSRELFLDCNPRIGRNSYYNALAGVNPMEVMVREAIDGTKDEVKIAGRAGLYTLVPLKLLRRYIRSKELSAEMEGYIKQGLVADPQRYSADWGLRRRFDVEITEINQFNKFKKYYPQPTDTSF